MIQLVKIGFLMVLSLLILYSTAHGEEDTAPPDDWEFNLAPLYLWAVSLNGDMTTKGNTNPVDVNFSDAIGGLSAVFTVHFEGLHKSRWGFLTDVAYVKLSGDQNTGGPTLHVNFENFLGELAGLYRFGEGSHLVDALLGIRYTVLKPKIGIGNIPQQFSQTENWVDPIIGARYTWNISDRWKLMIRGDIGGFGVGSDFTWNAAGLIDFKLWKCVSVMAGYRALYQDYKDGSGIDEFKYDVTMHGPILAFNINW